MVVAAEPASGSVMPMQKSSPAAADGSHRARRVSLPRCSMARGGPLNTSWHKIALDTSTRAISSRTMAASTSPMPIPPYASPTVTVNSSARRNASREASANSSVSSQPGAWGAMSRSATSRASLRSAARSSSSTRSIALTDGCVPPALARAGGVRTPDLTPSSVNLLH